jgi:hypothetical protein
MVWTRNNKKFKESQLETLASDIMERRVQQMRVGRHCREGEESKGEIVWTCNKK